MKAVSLLLVTCLLLSGAPVCRAQQAPAAARPDSTAVRAPAATAGDSLSRPPVDTLKSVVQVSAKPARRWDRTRIAVVGTAAALLVVTGIVAIKASYWPHSK